VLHSEHQPGPWVDQCRAVCVHRNPASCRGVPVRAGTGSCALKNIQGHSCLNFGCDNHFELEDESLSERTHQDW
jgi:hypothetical protein